MKFGEKIAVLLPDIRSVHNVGSIFRTSDALGIEKIYLTGTTPTPLDRFGRKRSDFAKVALGSEDNISWQYQKDALSLLKEMKKSGFTIISIEQDHDSIDYKKVGEALNLPAVFVFGNEVSGIDKEILKISDIVAEIPMKGKKESLNISVSFGIAMFGILDR